MADTLPGLDLTQFGATPQLDLSQFKPAKPTSPLGEIGTSALRGVLSGAPETVGQALQFVGAQDLGGAVRGFGERMGQASWLAAHPEGHGAVVRALSQGAEGIGTFLPAIGAGLVAGTVGAPETIAAGIGAVAAGALGGGSAGQQTLEKAEAKGVAPDAARTAANLNAAQSFAFNTVTGLVGGKMLGALGGPVGRLLGMEGPAQAEGVLSQLAGTEGVVKPLLKQLPMSAAEVTGAMVGQAGTQAAIERHYGVDETSPWEAMAQQIGPALGMTALMTPLGLAGRALGVRSAKARTDTLADAATSPEIRQQLAEQYTAALARVDPQKAAAFRANAQTAIDAKMGMPVNPTLFEPGAIAPPVSPLAEAGQVPRLPAPMARISPEPSGAQWTMPDGSVTSDINVVQAHIESLPPEQRDAVRAQIFGFEPAPYPVEGARYPTAPQAPVAAPATPQLTHEPAQGGNVVADGAGALYHAPVGQAFAFPDGSSSNDIRTAHEFITGLPEGERPAAWAKMIGLETPPAADVKTLDAHAQDVQALHGQVKDALAEAGVEPAQPATRAAFGEAQGLKGQELAKAYKAYLADPATHESLMRQDADRYQQLVAERAAAPAPALNRQAEQPMPAPARLNTQLADAMQTALHQKQVDAAYAAYDVLREHETGAIAHRARGEAEAAAAEAGTIQPDVNAPKALDEITRDADSVKQAAEGASDATMRAFDKRVENLGLDKLGSHPEQIDALVRAAEAGKMAVDVQTMMKSLAERWQADVPKTEAKVAALDGQPKVQAVLKGESAGKEKLVTEGGAPPPQAETLGKNIETPAPATAEQPAASARAQEALPANTALTPKQRAGALVDRLNAVLADFHTRDHNGERIEAMPELERQRYQDALDYRNSLSKIAKGETTSNGADWWRDMHDYVALAERPYLKPLEKQGPAEANTPLQARVAQGGKLSDTLAHLSEHGSTPGVQAVAARLNALGLDTTLHSAVFDAKTSGQYSPQRDRIEINQGHESEATVLHEATHAGLFHTIEQARLIDQPGSQREAQMKQALRDWEAIRQGALEHTSADQQYGLKNAHEFAAELMSNPSFQDFLKGLTAGGQRASLWTRAVDAVRRFLGLHVDARNALEKAMDASNVMLDAAKQSRDFEASPQGAARALDATLEPLAKRADEWGSKVPMQAVGRDVFGRMLQWKTVDFIAHQVRGNADMVRSGFAKMLDAYRRARDDRRIAARSIADPLGKYVDRVDSALRVTNDYKGLRNQMMTVGGEASIGGFDYRQNFAGNVKAGRALDASSKSWVDEIHRQYTQLAKAQPKLAQLLVEGEQHYRKQLVQTTAVLGSNLMGARTGIVPRLEAELARLPPNDASRARLENQLAGARTEAAFVNQHLRGLDMLGADLKTVRNGDAYAHLDGASYQLASRLSAAFKAAREQLPEGNALRAQLATLEGAYAPQVRNPYFSLGRDGDYFVNIAFKGKVDAQTQAKLQAALKGSNKVLGNLAGQDHAFFRVRSSDQAAGLFRKLVAAGGDALDVGKSAPGRLENKATLSASGVSPALRQLEQALHEGVELDSSLTPDQAFQMKQTLTRSLLSMLPETSARSASMQRRGVPGYDADFVGNFARRSSGAVQEISNLYTNRQFAAALKGMKDSATAMNRGGAMQDSAERAQRVADEINQRYANGMTPFDNAHVNLVNSLGNSFYLALSPAFLIRTMAQPWHRGLPLLAARFGAVRSARELAGATGTAIKLIQQSIAAGWQEGGVRGAMNTGLRFKDLGLPPADTAFMQEMHDRGVFELGNAQQLQQLMTGAPQWQRDVTRVASAVAQYSEMTNRMITGLAAFRMAMRERGMAPQAATDFAMETVNNVMDNFDPENTARATSKFGMAGKVTPLMSAFMNYRLQTMQQIARTVQDGFFAKPLPGESAEQLGVRKAQAQKEFGGLLATTAMISGVMGLPFATAFAGLYNQTRALTNPNDPNDVRGDVRNFLNNTFGGTAGDIIANGVGHTINMDTSTFGLQDLLPFSEFLASRQKWQDRIEAQSQQLLGPALNAGIDIALGASKIYDGNYIKGIEQMLPSGLKPAYKVAELTGALGPGGYTNSKGLSLPAPFDKAGGWDVLLQGLGFRTGAKATHDEAQAELSATDQQLESRREVLGQRLLRAQGDPAATQNALSDVKAFNLENPWSPMRNLGEVFRRHAIEQAIGAATGTGIAAGRRDIPRIRRDLGYAAMPAGQ
jgi:hypothetical protein